VKISPHQIYDSSASTDELIDKKIAEIAACEDDMPGIIIILNADNFGVRYLSKRGREILGVTNDELQGMGIYYHTQFLKAENPTELLPAAVESLLHNNSDEIISLYQEFRTSAQYNYSWFYAGMKVLLRNNEGIPELLIVMAIPLDPMPGMAEKTERITDDHNYLLRNQHKLHSLTKREKELLKLFAIGKTNEAISRDLFISIETVATHRKNIKRKLGCKSNYDCTHFAQLFNLI
jgi:DNA-binding CsgD family transcriptional regulator